LKIKNYGHIYFKTKGEASFKLEGLIMENGCHLELEAYMKEVDAFDGISIA